MVKSEKVLCFSLFTFHSSLVLRHHFFATLQNLAHHALLGNRKYLQAISASLIQLFPLHLVHLRQVSLCPLIFDELKGVVFSERMSFPIRRQQDAAQVRMVSKAHTKEIVDLAFHPISRGPDLRHTINACTFR